VEVVLASDGAGEPLAGGGREAGPAGERPASCSQAAAADIVDSEEGAQTDVRNQLLTMD
jgi:hypothetical protein